MNLFTPVEIKMFSNINDSIKYLPVNGIATMTTEQYFTPILDPFTIRVWEDLRGLNGEEAADHASLWMSCFDKDSAG